MICVLNYANNLFKYEQHINTLSAKRIGLADLIINYSPISIDDEFKRNNYHILSQKRGNGFWLWKSYCILDAIGKINNGDYLFYSDSGVKFINSIYHLIPVIECSKFSILPFELNHLECKYTKRDTFILMDADQPEYTKTNQRTASYIFLKKDKFSVEFMHEYKRFCQNEYILTDIPNKYSDNNYEGFIDHRHDQSVFSILTKKYNISSFRDPSQFGNQYSKKYLNSPYPQIVEHTRKLKNSFSKRLFDLQLNIFKKNIQ